MSPGQLASKMKEALGFEFMLKAHVLFLLLLIEVTLESSQSLIRTSKMFLLSFLNNLPYGCISTKETSLRGGSAPQVSGLAGT